MAVKTYPPTDAVKQFVIELFEADPTMTNLQVKEQGDAWVTKNYPGDTFPWDPGRLASARKELDIRKTGGRAQPVTAVVTEPAPVVVMGPPEEENGAPPDIREAAELMLTYMRQHDFISLQLTDDGVVEFTQRIVRKGTWRV